MEFTQEILVNRPMVLILTDTDILCDGAPVAGVEDDDDDDAFAKN